LRKVLLLNSSYEPLHICSWQRALVLLIKGKAEAVEKQTRCISKGRWPMPIVIRLLYYVKIPHKEVSLTRRNILHRDGYACQYCGKKNELTIDHIIPRSRGGKDSWDNVAIACLRCNLNKGNRTPKEAGLELRSKPTRPYNCIQFELSRQSYVSSREAARWRKYFYQLD
jgi:5-methylcytosine-specific restriction endonuclease McrA